MGGETGGMIHITVPPTQPSRPTVYAAVDAVLAVSPGLVDEVVDVRLVAGDGDAGSDDVGADEGDDAAAQAADGVVKGERLVAGTVRAAGDGVLVALGRSHGPTAPAMCGATGRIARRDGVGLAGTADPGSGSASCHGAPKSVLQSRRRETRLTMDRMILKTA